MGVQSWSMDLFNSCDHASVCIYKCQVASYQRQYGLQPCPRTESPLFPHSIVPETHYDSHGLLNGRPGQCSTLNRSIRNCEGAPFLGYGQFFDVDPLLARYCVGTCTTRPAGRCGRSPAALDATTAPSTRTRLRSLPTWPHNHGRARVLSTDTMYIWVCSWFNLTS
jgi:hypothetical protein